MDAVVAIGGIVGGMLADHGVVHGVELDVGRLQRLAGGEATEQFGHAMDAALDHRRREMMWTGDDIGDDFGVGGVGNRRLKDTDDRGRSLTEANLFADHGGIAFKHRSPEAMGEHGGTGGVRTVVMRVQQPANYWVQTHHLEILAVNHTGLYFARLPKAEHGEADGREIAEGADRLYAGFEVGDFGDGKGGVLNAEAHGTLANIDQ